MRVKIGKYKNFWGVYQIAELLKYLGVSEERHEKIAEWLGETWVNTFLQWVHKKRGGQVVKVHIDPWDTWSMDYSLGLIALPMLKQLKATKHGAPFVEYEDVPEHLRPSQEELDSLEVGSTDQFWFDRWEWVMDEMIFAFESLQTDWEDEFHTGEIEFVSVPVDVHGNEVDEKDAEYFRMDRGPNDTSEFDFEGMKIVQARITNGFRLFGTYFTGLWD